MNQIVVVGTSHHTAPVDFRERLSFSENQLIEALQRVKQTEVAREVVLLSTCNRVEMYAVVPHDDSTARVADFLSTYHRLDSRLLEKHTYRHCGFDAVRYLFKVTSSLDSMIVGEPQILGQVKEAYEQALAGGTTGEVFNHLFPRAISVSKRVRTETSIGAGAVSISYAAVELAKKIFQSLEGKTVAILGAGEMSELTAQHLVDNGVSKVIVANRTYERAVKVAEKFNGIPLAYDANLEFLTEADIVISSTNAPHYLIERRPLAEIMKRRRHRYMFLIDIAVPRDIDPEVNKVENAFLYNIDDLEAVVAANLKERQQEASIAAEIVEQEAARFYAQLQVFGVNPTVKALHQQFQQVAAHELAFCLRKARLSPEQEQIVRAMTQSIVKKLLHKPTKHLRQSVNRIDVNHMEYVKALQTLFALEFPGGGQDTDPAKDEIERG